MIQLLHLPEELLTYIFTFLPLQSLINVSCTSQQAKVLISSSSLLQYSMCLQSSSYTSYRDGIPVAEALQQLKEVERAWAEWKVKRHTRLDIKHLPSGIYDLTCGVFLLGETSSQVGRTTEALKWVDLQDQNRGWRSLNLQSEIVDLGLNVHEWDLIAILTYQITQGRSKCRLELNLLQLSASTGSRIKLHPMASQPVLPILDYPVHHGRCSLSMEIVGSYLALLIIFPYSNLNDQLYIFDWMTGKMLFVREAQRTTYSCLAFLSDDVIVLPNRVANTLELCSFTRSHEMRHSIATAFGDDCQQLHPDFPSAIPLCTLVTLKLPRLFPDVLIARISCRGEPNPSSSSTSKPAREGHEFLFRPQANSSIINFIIGFWLDGLAQRCVSLIVHRNALLAQIDSHNDCTSNMAAEDGVQWRDWGPDITRWFPADEIPTNWITNTCGQRWASINEVLPSSIFIRDFNPYNIRRAIRDLGGKDSYEKDNCVITVVDTPSCASDGNDKIFDEYVESNLPYIETRTREQFRYSSVFMDDFLVLGIVEDEFSSGLKAVEIFAMK